MIKKIVFFAILTSVIVGCRHDHNQESGHADHEEMKNQFTVYTDDFELFAEADAFILGHSSNVLSHFTNLPGFTALEKGSITLRLIVGGKETSQSLDKPTRKGIYSFNLSPETPGRGRLIFEITTENGEFKLVVPRITVFQSHDNAHHAEDESVISHTNTMVFTKEQSWKIDFETSHPVIEAFGQVIKTTARVRPAHGDEVVLAARMSGMVNCFAEDVIIGKAVKRGQVLFTISGSGLANNNSAVRFNEAKNNYEKAGLGYERAKELARDKIVSEKTLLEAKNEYDNAKIIYYNLKKNFDSSGQKIISPKDGYINQLFAEHGQYVEAGQAIVNISENNILMLYADVQQKYSGILGAVNSANIHIMPGNRIFTLEELNGKIISFGRSTNNDNFMIPLSLQIQNNGSFIPGGFVEVYLKTLTNTSALTVPNTTLLEEQGIYYVFVQITPELFEKREISVGATDGLKSEVLKGISETDRIVCRGALHIKLAQATGTLDAHSGHVH